jgi:uncharacterized SAM-binding protein YcdF (DUF218 family)
VTGGARTLADHPEIAVVLGAGLEDDGSPTETTLARADAAASLARERDMAVIVSGSHGDGPAPQHTEAYLMAERLVAKGISGSRIFLEDESRDTVANAALVAERYLAGIAPRRLVIVTSPFHVARALAIFAMVLGPSWPLEAHLAPRTGQDEAREATETLYLGHARALLEGTAPGDITRIAARVRARADLPTPRRR